MQYVSISNIIRTIFPAALPWTYVSLLLSTQRYAFTIVQTILDVIFYSWTMLRSSKSSKRLVIGRYFNAFMSQLPRPRTVLKYHGSQINDWKTHIASSWQLNVEALFPDAHERQMSVAIYTTDSKLYLPTDPTIADGPLTDYWVCWMIVTSQKML